MPHKITVKKDFLALKIYINSVLHLYIDLEDFYALQSWYSSLNIYHIIIYFKKENPFAWNIPIKIYGSPCWRF